MTPSALRFHPPQVPTPPAVRWMLLRAFGPPEASFPDPFAAAEALALARRFGLSPRISARQGRARLTSELGPEAAAGFHRDRLATAAIDVQLEELARDLARTAAQLGVPLVFLKSFGLYLAGCLSAGSRPAGDLDVLAPAGEARRLHRALLAAGSRAAEVPEREHHLVPLYHPRGAVLELHPLLPGVRLGPGRVSATTESLAARGLLVALPDWPGSCFRPAPAVLAAHALVHGIAQHGHFPDAYPLFKMVADLADLGFARPAGDDLAAQLGPWVARDLRESEVAAVRRLCADLVAGGLPDPATPAGLLLRHLLAGRLDPEYQSALRLGLFHSSPSDRSAMVRLAGSLVRALVLSRTQIDVIYGPPASAWGYLGRRLARPFDLAWRLGRSWASARRLAERTVRDEAAGGPLV